MKKKFFRWAKIIVLVYAALGIALYYLQDHILIHPAAIQKNKPYGFTSPFREINIPYNAETNLNIIQFITADSAKIKGVVLYFHGNRKNISWYEKYVHSFTSQGYELWMIDYPGFGKSTGAFTEEKLYAYALELYKLARTRYKPINIVIYGKSMGTGIAAELAAVRDCKYLILETPYYSMTSLAAHYFPIYPVSRLIHYKFPTNVWLMKVTAPVILFHGTEDAVIPYSQSEKLSSVLKPQDELVRIERGRHNDLNQFLLYHQKLDSLLKY
jgi:alpha-beta hydrolase superfamily lysophospholipase